MAEIKGHTAVQIDMNDKRIWAHYSRYTRVSEACAAITAAVQIAANFDKEFRVARANAGAYIVQWAYRREPGE